MRRHRDPKNFIPALRTIAGSFTSRPRRIDDRLHAERGQLGVVVTVWLSRQNRRRGPAEFLVSER
jgi:hypothetical protein